MIPVQFYNKILEDIHNAGLNIKWMYFSGRGEPGLHSDLWKMVETAKNLFDTNFLVNTNGNIKYDDMIVDSGLDKIKIAFESLYQETYGRYRVKGSVKRLLDLTQKIAERKRATDSNSPLIIWQKILFNYNDSDEELIEYQNRALEYGVDMLRIVYTWTADHSTKSPQDFPKIFPNIEFLDTYERDNIGVERMRAEFEDAFKSRHISKHIDLASKILHWFELGTETRDDYDEFATLPFADERLYALRKEDPFADEFKKILKGCLFELSAYYKKTGDDSESSSYSELSQSIDTK